MGSGTSSAAAKDERKQRLVLAEAFEMPVAERDTLRGGKDGDDDYGNALPAGVAGQNISEIWCLEHPKHQNLQINPKLHVLLKEKGTQDLFHNFRKACFRENAGYNFNMMPNPMSVTDWNISWNDDKINEFISQFQPELNKKGVQLVYCLIETSTCDSDQPSYFKVRWLEVWDLALHPDGFKNECVFTGHKFGKTYF